MTARARGYHSEWDQMNEDYNCTTYDAQYPDDEVSGGVELDHCRLYITNVPKMLTNEGLRMAFSKYGTLTEVHLSKDPQKKYAIVRFETPGEAKLAMSKLNKTEPLKLNIFIAHKTKKSGQNNRDQARERPDRDGLSARPIIRDDTSSVDSRVRSIRKQMDLTNGDNDVDDDALGDDAFDVDMLDPEIHLELEQIKLKQLELQEKQVRCKQRMLLIKQSKKVANLNTSSNRCILPDGRIVVRNVNERNLEHREADASYGTGAGDSRVRSRACVTCGSEEADLYCARCGVTPYCSPACQRRDWSDRHKAVCHNLARLAGGRLDGQHANNSTEAQPAIPAVMPLRRPYSPAKSTKREPQHKQAAEEPATDNQNRVFNPPGQNMSRQTARNSNQNNNRGNTGGGGRYNNTNNYNRNRASNDRRPQKQNSQEDENWDKGAFTKPESKDVKLAPSPKNAPNSPKSHSNVQLKAKEVESPKTQEPTNLVKNTTSNVPQTKNPKEPTKAPGSLTDVTPGKKPLVPKNYLIEQLSIGDTFLLSVEGAAADCATKRPGFVCLSMHESYNDQYMKLCEDYILECEADTVAFTPSLGETFSYLSPDDGGWYRARLLATDRAALLDSCRVVALQATDGCKRLPPGYDGMPEFACLLSANVKVGENLSCKILSKFNDGFKVLIQNIDTNMAVGEGEVFRWVPDIEYPATVQKAPIPEVVRPPVANNSKVLLVDMTACDRVFVRPADPTAVRCFDDLLANVVVAAANASPLTEPPRQGQTVIGQYTDGLYYRALCKRTNVKQNKYLLEYIDFGNVEISTLEKLYPCPADYEMSAEPTLASLVTLPLTSGTALTALATEYIDKLKDSNAELLLTIPSGDKTAPSGSPVTLTVVKTNQSVNKRIEELSTPEWKKLEIKGGDVIDTEPVMYADLEYLELPPRDCEMEILDVSALEAGTLSGCERCIDHAMLERLTDRMADYCKSDIGKQPYLPKHDELCIAKFPPYPQWFRAVLLEHIPGEADAKVCYVDYGNVGFVPVMSIRKMLPEFVRGHPAVASHLEIKDFPKDPTPDMLARAVVHMKINDEGRGLLRVSRCLKQEPGLYIIEVPELLAAMKDNNKVVSKKSVNSINNIELKWKQNPL
ncbi:uncharacterized protein LOC113520882 [Galleria mellonella]|uniref:Uncharacterized protein LOC113520882 n=1 Tax=Galleria mellonella TaxID=7137 RepID=A0ABM3M9P2_GALME|nr:uncharacterized protein LOC113520882 [Galleria mellonella]